MKTITIVSMNGKRKVIIENIATGIDRRKEAVDIIMKNQPDFGLKRAEG